MATTQTTQRAARGLVTDITAAVDDGDHETAARVAGWGVESFPDAAVFHRLRGVALAALGATDEAKADLNAALVVDPLDHEALIALSRIEEAEGDPYTAAEYLLTAWEHDPANGLLRADLTARLAQLYGSEGYLQYTRPALAALYVRNAAPERAAREYAAALAEQPNRVDLRLASLLARWRLGALAEAADGCVLLLDEQPRLVRARWALADTLARRGRGEEARDHATHAALLDPDGTIARAMIAGNPDATIVDPDEMVRVPPGSVRSGPRVTALDAVTIPDPVPLDDALVDDLSTDETDLAETPDPVPLIPAADLTGLVAPVAPVAPVVAALTDDTAAPPAPSPVSDEGDDAVVSTGDTASPAALEPEFAARANAELDTVEETIAALERTLAALNAGNIVLADRAERVRELDVGEIGLPPLPPVAFAAPRVSDPPVEEAPWQEEALRGEIDASPFATTPSAPPADTEAMQGEAGEAGTPEGDIPEARDVPEADDFAVLHAPEELYLPSRTIEEVETAWDDAAIAGDATAEPLMAEPLPAPEPGPPQPEAEPEPEPYVAVVTEGGDVLTAQPGEEPLLEAADALPAAPEPHEDAASPAAPVVAPVIAIEQEPESQSPPPITEPLPSVAPPPVAVVPVPPSAPAFPPAPDDLLPGIRRHIAAGDVAVAVGLGRLALGAAGKDATRVRALLPALRSIVGAAPARPDAHRLLGDAYRRLGQMPQAQGQYQQALLMRIAGKQ